MYTGVCVCLYVFVHVDVNLHIIYKPVCSQKETGVLAGPPAKCPTPSRRIHDGGFWLILNSQGYANFLYGSDRRMVCLSGQPQTNPWRSTSMCTDPVNLNPELFGLVFELRVTSCTPNSKPQILNLATIDRLDRTIPNAFQSLRLHGVQGPRKTQSSPGLIDLSLSVQPWRQHEPQKGKVHIPQVLGVHRARVQGPDFYLYNTCGFEASLRNEGVAETRRILWYWCQRGERRLPAVSIVVPFLV